MNPQSGYILLIINPKSGASENKTLLQQFSEYLESNGFKLDIQYTNSLAHARQLANEAAVRYDCAMVIACGGDGTIREIAHGLEGSDKPLMLVPCGTENLLANELGYKKNLKTLIETFNSQKLHLLDLCKANERFFTSVGGIGFDGDVVKLVDAQRKGHITHLHYFIPIVRAFLDYDFPKFTVEADGEIIFCDRGIAIFGNISRYALGLPVLKKADYGDGLLDLCIYKCSNRPRLLAHSLATIFKRHIKSGSVIYRQCKKIKIYSSSPMATELDGDPGPAMPLEIDIVPAAVKILIPPSGKPAGMRRRLIRIFK